MAVQGARQHFRDQLLELERAALGGLDMALGQVERVLMALENVDLRLAQFIIADDDRIDGRFLEVHQGVLSLLALQAPVAGDLRLVAAVLHMINNIERVGDQCVNVAKLIPLPEHGAPEGHEISDRIQLMGAAAREELTLARRSFADRDCELAASLATRDRDVDRFNREIFRLAVEAGENPDLREWAMTTTLIARAIERIGGNAVDIADQTIFVATGAFRRMTPTASGRQGA
jgi:phosphate transport system protein